MKIDTASTMLSALANEHRLAAFRALVRHSPDGLSAGDLAQHLGISPSALSFHLSQLQNAGLVRSQRQQRHIFYSIDPANTRRMIAFLTDDCCGGRPELCLGTTEPGESTA